MKLYHHPFSSNARKAVVTALLLEAPVELVVVDLVKGDQRAPEFLKLNPNGKVPVLVDGELTLWESLAIMQYLCDRTPGNTLLPTEARARADVSRWMFWTAAHWTQQIATLNFENMLKKMFGQGEPDPAIVGKAEAQMRGLGKILDAHLADREWLVGDRLTLADLAVGTGLMTTIPAKLPVTDLPNVQRWFGQIQALEAWQKTSPPR
jgi:glutathione S-transferase